MAGVRNYRTSADGLVNGRVRPIARIPDQPGTGGEHQKADVRATRRLRQDRRLMVIDRAFDGAFGPNINATAPLDSLRRVRDYPDKPCEAHPWMSAGGFAVSNSANIQERFRDNKIDADVLADLADGDLEKLGLPLGDRKRFLKAVAGLATRLEPAQAQPPGSTVAQSTSAERRPITVMFCDLVGSTGLAAKLDPEDWRNLVNAYLDEASGAVTGFGGHVLKKLGDGLMALFGYPQAQENDAERAVRAALAIQRALEDINRNRGKSAPELLARIGLKSGPSSWRRQARCSATLRMSPPACRPSPSRVRCS